MVEHLTREQIAALLDEPDAVADGLAHLDVCSDCAGEYEAMSRTRMALSALPELRAPEGAWEEIRASLPVGGAREGVHPAGGAPRTAGWWSLQTWWGPPAAAAAILVLFLGGLGVGRALSPGSSADEAEGGLPAALALEDGATARTDGPAISEPEYPEYLRNVAGLQELRSGGPSRAEIAADPALAAERVTRLDALIEASREALRTAPADPALNDFLFDVVDERASVAGQLDQTIRQASMEY